MKAVVQRVKQSSVMVDGIEISRIGYGLAILLGVGRKDTQEDVKYLAEKIANLRIFEDSGGKMNLSLLDIGGEALIVSQFTLMADCKKGRRPGFDNAASPDYADMLYNLFIENMRAFGLSVKTGKFQAEMLVKIENDGPVTIILDTDDIK